jgi:bifunctional non-homologous end joining protein LigD
MSLEAYKRKRHFQRTPEPEGRPRRRSGYSFVVQKHAARHLHYDFRLEWDGVLKSWAVPKGPSLDPTIKRLAIQVEDHPVEYGSFEGIIPQGEYGGGTVMLWDRGTWEPVGDAGSDLQYGRLKFRLHGEKLRGAWMLLRTGGPRQSEAGKPQWLLFKEKDEYARLTQDADVLQEQPLSVRSGRSLEEIAAKRDSVWRSRPQGVSGNTSSTSAGDSAKPRPKLGPTSKPTPQLPIDRELLVRMQRYDAKKQTLRGVRLTSPEKVLYPEDGITKLELAAYFQMVAKWMLPHVAHRPIMLVRCPEGRHGECFYQKHPAVGTPETLRRIPVRKDKKTETFVVVDDVKSLVSLAQVSALEVHAWGSREDKLHQPDRLIFDLDPDVSLPWERVVQSARQVRDLLEELGLKTFVKTTGGKGLHLVIPIVRRHDWDDVKTFCRLVASLVVKFDPHHYTVNMSKAQRPGKIFIDYLRNAWEATAIAPYSPRARPGATVAVPLTWEELDDLPSGSEYTTRNLSERLSRLKRDPWAAMKSIRQGLSEPMKKLRLVYPDTEPIGTPHASFAATTRPK